MGREDLSLQVFDLCQYSALDSQKRWRETGRMYHDINRRHLGVIDEQGEHYWICYYESEHFEQDLI